MTVVGIHQPNYLPWLGYFRKIAESDVFVFFDNVQMPGGKSFVSRNAIKSPTGRAWLTVPILRNGHGQRIADVEIADRHWPRKHLMSLRVNYGRSPWMGLIDDAVAPALEAGHERLADLNIDLIKRISGLCGLEACFERATALAVESEGAASIPDILAATGACTYLTGSGAGTTRHLDVDALAARGIATRFMSGEFPAYDQPHGPFEPRLSVIDAILSCGPKRTREMLLSN